MKCLCACLTLLALVSSFPGLAGAEMRFKHHFGDRDLSGSGWGQTALTHVDGDGDLDVCSKLWRPMKSNANRGCNHFDYLENLAR